MSSDKHPPELGGDGPAFQPHVPAEARMAECTPRALILGTLLGVVFGASSLYLMLKVGITVSASIPVAVISLTLFRLWAKLSGGRDATILENNIVQTAGSAGRIHRLRRGRDDAGDPDSGLRSGDDAGDAGRRCWGRGWAF